MYFRLQHPSSSVNYVVLAQYTLRTCECSSKIRLIQINERKKGKGEKVDTGHSTNLRAIRKFIKPIQYRKKEKTEEIH